MRRIVVLSAAVMALLLLSAPPATAGTEIKDNPSGLQVTYEDHRPNPAHPQGNWFDITTHVDGYGSHTCSVNAKWGNWSGRGFVQLKQTGGSYCVWGGIHMKTLYHRAPYPDAIVDTYSGGDYCVGSTLSTNVGNCVQLSDGSIWLQRNIPADATDMIVEADIIVCAAQDALLNHEHCWHEFDDIAF